MRNMAPRDQGSPEPRSFLAAKLTCCPHYRVRIWLFLTVLVLLLWGLLKSQGPSEPFEHSSVVLHLIGFFGLALSARYALDRLSGRVLWPLLLLSAPALEVLQALVQPVTRQFSALDIAGNLLGIVLAHLLWPALRTRFSPGC